MKLELISSVDGISIKLDDNHTNEQIEKKVEEGTLVYNEYDIFLFGLIKKMKDGGDDFLDEIKNYVLSDMKSVGINVTEIRSESAQV